MCDYCMLVTITGVRHTAVSTQRHLASKIFCSTVHVINNKPTETVNYTASEKVMRARGKRKRRWDKGDEDYQGRAGE